MSTIDESLRDILAGKNDAPISVMLWSRKQLAETIKDLPLESISADCIAMRFSPRTIIQSYDVVLFVDGDQFKVLKHRYLQSHGIFSLDAMASLLNF